MKSPRPVITLVLCALIGGLFAGTAAPGQSLVFETKHNLSAGGTGTIKAATESQVCVFCHTPHAPRATVQLWNHQLSTTTYELYSSDYLTHLNYETPNQPNQRSKFCLSCHDGTVAIGAVYNNRQATSIAMANGLTTLPAHSPSNLGASLRDDHPVGFVVDNSKDPELASRTWPWGTSVKLDPDASNGTIECQTCHDPHDNTNGNFLRMANTDAALCTFCHTKAGWTDAIHNTSTQSYLTPDSIRTTVGEAACRDCHKSHGGEGFPYLLTRTEENTCFTAGCHGTSLTGVNTKNIESEFLKTYSHPTVAVAGKHKNPDARLTLDSPNRHAECQDCHNGHQAKKGLHTPGANGVSNVLLGVRGVFPGATNEWEQPTTFTDIPLATEENQICLKCHSSYAFGQVPNGVTTIVGAENVNITDQAMEFNPNNHSAHPVRQALLLKPLAAQQMTPEWSNVGNQTMYCSDCHGNDEATSASSPQGPHGSTAPFMLTGQRKYWPSGSDGQPWTLNDLKNGIAWRSELFCANCHALYDAGSFTNNAHSSLDHQGAKCVTCHVAVPHGAKRSRLIGYASDVAPYNYNGELRVTGFEKAMDPFQYTRDNCATSCHTPPTFGTYEP